MAWIYLVASEESPLPWHRGSDLSPSVKSTDMLSLFCYHEWQLATLTQPPSGMTFRVWEDLLLMCQLTSSPVVSHARTLVLQDLVQAWKETEADCFSRSQGSLASYDRDSYSWRTCQLSLLEAASTLLQPLPRWGMTRGGVLYQLNPLVHPISVTGGFCWPTPTVTGNFNRKGASQKSGDGLETAVKMWPTPKATRRGDCPSERERRTPDLHSAVKMYPTPMSRDWKDSGPTQGNRKSPNLGSVIGGQLNPTWVEWLMGYQLGWTELNAWAMQWFRPKRAKRSRS